MRLPTASELLVSLSFLLPARRRSLPAPRPRRARLSVEALEARAVPSANFAWAINTASAATGSPGPAGTRVVADAAGDAVVSGYLTNGTATFGTGANAVTLT